MVQHRAERVVGVVGLRRDLDRLRDRDPEAPRGVLGLGAAGLGELGGAAVDGRSPGLHHRPAVGLLVVADPDHEHLALHVEQPAGQRQRRAPLAGAGLGGQLLHALALVEVGLRDGGVRLVRAGGRDALVLVVDVRRGVEGALQAPRAVEGRRAPQLVDLAHLVGNLDLGLGGDLLLDQPHGEDRRQVLRPERLLGARVERGVGRRAEVGEQVHPMRGDLGLG